MRQNAAFAFLTAVCALTAVPAFAQQAAQATKVVTPTVSTPAQVAASAVASRSVSNTEISDAIRRSGMTQEAVRARLQAAGYDPALADPFFAPTAGVTQEVNTNGSTSLDAATPVATYSLEAFQALGLVPASANGASGANGDGDPSAMKANAPAPTPVRRGGDASYAVFGKDVFNGASTAFDPIASGPVDPSYRLGVGDQLQFILTGDVEAGYQIEIRRDGTVLLPQLGQIAIGGLTMDAARAVLRRRAGQAYSGIQTGTTRLDVSVQRIRSNAIFVIGEVEHPGALVVNALSTAFHALAKAGGPNARGSFRNIEVRRGGEVVRRLDLYKYLLDGDASSDLRTEHGDVIYTSLAERTVRITGAVRRPGTFELLPREGFQDLLHFVGGMLPTASLDRVQIDRVLPADQRSPGVERAIIDVRIGGSLDSLALTRLYDGDVITVFFVGDLRRNAVLLRGEVLQPGTYELEPGLTLGELLDRAHGLMPWALADRVKVMRPLAETGKTEELSLDVSRAEARDFVLREFDQVVVLDGRIPGGTVSVGGAVWRPGMLIHAENQTLLDAIDAAGGLKPEATAIVVSRKRIGDAYSDTTSQLQRFNVDRERAWELAAAGLTLSHDDHVYVLSSPGVRDQRFVAVTGLFAFPGTYAINESVDRIADLVRRAGSPLPGAFAGNFHLTRNGLPMPVDLGRALQGDPVHNVLLQDGDKLFIGANPSTVLVTGEVGRTVLVLHRPGYTLRDYVEMAGGPLPNADFSKSLVEDLSGNVARSRKYLWLITWNPPIAPGAKITVPARAKPKATLGEFVNSTLQYSSLLTSMIVAYVIVDRSR